MGFTDGTVPDFIQKLFRMLENDSSESVLTWGLNGTTFIVRDTMEFSRTVLPKHFKHSNFASFVRQLNKYDFHKVRQVDDSRKSYDSQAWEFVHPKFIRHRKDLLEEIKRKVPRVIKQSKKENEQKPCIQVNPSSGLSNSLEEIQAMANMMVNEIEQLQTSRTALESSISKLTQRDKDIQNEFKKLNASLLSKDNLTKDFLKLIKKTAGDVNVDEQEAQSLLASYERISIANTEQMERLNKEMGLNDGVKRKQMDGEEHINLKRVKMEDTSIPMPIGDGFDSGSFSAAAAAAAASMNAGSLIGSPLKTADGLTFVTLGRLSSNMSVRDNKPAIEIMAADQTPTLGTTLQRPTIDMKRTSSFGMSSSSQISWTVPPRILLVDDDSVYRDLSERLLQVFGCTIDLAKDGVEALKKMSLEKYDLILMDIVMPKMDGISATRSIRQYDALTPIVSMTSNFTDNDIVQYIGSGMTDILPKPFSKRTLYQMLDKYCAHLKSIQRVQDKTGTSSIPSALDILPMTKTSSSTKTQHSPPPQPSSYLFPIPTSNAAPSSSSSSTAPTVFPLAPYPYPITMNSVSSDANNNNPVHAVQNDIPNVTFWPQQPNQNQGRPPAIIASAGKFTWAMPTSNNS
ncbi:hypothetical protein G6F57_006584 [Rhizopus arrhizus]|uniref:Transcription factor n=1 Tax=Rhizopus oryzae TaxID=64495 RepID=A0A9P6X963_RHIOR|nr:hypothetical protein G6F23_003433 [Rhizopus arrhizus]KAG1423963.1 hypothetical protein G6F58_002606 [Rhizopus delemar]KAG0767602.1 hypothetical protein G6F24_002639 [Rhizopus arrhizus]KAG0796993.1 hypothetical protein G6F21_000880 [Rhizopus arrhizus]KAG0801037.1 hypothetical protein G6F22_001640 [Rhizopus arrhizus]